MFKIIHDYFNPPLPNTTYDIDNLSNDADINGNVEVKIVNGNSNITSTITSNTNTLITQNSSAITPKDKDIYDPNKDETFLVTCSRCKRQVHHSKIYHVHSKGKISFECINSKECFEVTNQRSKKKIEPTVKHLEEHYKNNPNTKNLPKEQQFKEIFNIDFNDLKELPRFRDGCIHYAHTQTLNSNKHQSTQQNTSVRSKRYTWNMFKRKWEINEYF